ncbi:MAG TPA: DUF2795 domain-containing protein [Planctomycetota bacterium]|nr:DUF2795 domain-containing protein [Planctomycetota bacterium]
MSEVRVSPAQVEKFLKGIDFPAGKQDIINHAKQNKATDDVMQLLQQMPDKDYASAADVAKEIGKVE